MPTVFRQDGFRFFFYSNEGSPLEPVHVHVVKADAEAKFWIDPEVKLERSDGFDARTLRKLLDIIQKNEQQIREKWNEHFG